MQVIDVLYASVSPCLFNANSSIYGMEKGGEKSLFSTDQTLQEIRGKGGKGAEVHGNQPPRTPLRAEKVREWVWGDERLNRNCPAQIITE